MKKFTTVVLLCLLSAILFSCGGGKSKMITKNWKATELTLGETKLAADALGGVSLTFNEDGTFSYAESGSAEKGTWVLNNDGSQITLKYNEGGRTVVQNIQELTAEKLVINSEEHEMKRSVVLIPDNKEETK